MNFGPFAQRHGAIGSDGRLAIFPDEATGYKAMGALLDVYGRRGQNTVASIIGGLPDKPNLAWAPRGVDNNSTDTYIQKVASKLGISPNAPVPPDMREPLMRAMAEYEAGVPLGSVPRPSQPVQPVQSAQGATMTPQAPQLPAYTGATPNDVETQRKMAQALMMQGMSTEPVGHWTQALARVLQGASGGMYQAQARKGEQQGRAAGNAAMVQALQGGDPTAAVPALLGNGWTRDLGENIAKSSLMKRMDPNAEINKQMLQAELQGAQLKNKVTQRDLDTPPNKTMIIPPGASLATADPRNPQNFNVLHTAPKPQDSTSKKAVWEAQDEIPNIKASLEAFDEMKSLVPKAYHGFGSQVRSSINEGMPGWVPNLLSNPDRAKATTRLNILLSEQAISSMSAALKGATTDTEMRAFKEMIANPNISPQNKIAAINAMQRRAERAMQGKVERIKELGGTVPEYSPVQQEPKLEGKAPGSPVQIKGVDDYNLLPPGTPYIDPNGVQRIKGQKGTN